MLQAPALNGVRARLRAAGSQANKGYAFVERNWYLTKRYWGWELVWLTYNIVNSLSVTFIAASAPSLLGKTYSREQINTAVLYLAIGTAIWTYVSVVFDGVTETITMERWEGTIEYTFMAPVSRFVHMFGTCAFALLHGLVLTVLQLVVLGLFFHLDLGGANWPTALLVMVIGSISLIGLGIVSAVLPMLFTERGSQMAYIIRAILLLVSGVYYPITVLPNWMQVAAKASPAYYMLDGLRQSIMQGKSVVTIWDDVWPLIICGIVAVPLGLWIFSLAERYAKRTGKLKRNG
ncbi:MAG TPA: ABC transporter permease [Ktedonobacterales bacterium]